MIAHAFNMFQNFALVEKYFGRHCETTSNFCSHHAFPGNGRQFWSSSLLLLIASEVADFPITCFCFVIIVFGGKEELGNL